MYYSKSTGGFYDKAIHAGLMPADAVEISQAFHSELLEGQAAGLHIVAAPDGLPILIDPPIYVPVADELCVQIDAAADAARHAVAGDPLRALEYDRARIQAEVFAAGGFEGEVPPMVAAWVTSERTPQEAAEGILTEAGLYTQALELLRTTRLQAKEQIRALMVGGEVEQAQQLTEQTVMAIQAAVAGVGNAGS